MRGVDGQMRVATTPAHPPPRSREWRAIVRHERWLRSSSQCSAQLGDAKDQHERFAIRKGAEAPSLVEPRRLIVERLDDDGARSDYFGSGQRSFPGIDQQVRAKAPSLICRVYRKLSHEDHRDRLRHAPADARRHPASFHGTGCQAVEGDYPISMTTYVLAPPFASFSRALRCSQVSRLGAPQSNRDTSCRGLSGSGAVIAPTAAGAQTAPPSGCSAPPAHRVRRQTLRTLRRRAR